MKEDLNVNRLLRRQYNTNKLAQPWQWQVKISGPTEADAPPIEWDLYAKDITYGPVELETEAVKVGLLTITVPTGAVPTTVSMTMRDNEDRRIYTWFEKAAMRIFGKTGNTVNGTFALPAAYILTLRLLNRATGKEIGKWEVFAQKLGDITESVDGDGFLEFPIVFMQHRTL